MTAQIVITALSVALYALTMVMAIGLEKAVREAKSEASAKAIVVFVVTMFVIAVVLHAVGVAVS